MSPIRLKFAVISLLMVCCVLPRETAVFGGETPPRLWIAKLRSGQVVPVEIARSGSPPRDAIDSGGRSQGLSDGLQLSFPGNRGGLGDIVELFPASRPHPGPTPRAPRITLATGDAFQGWPLLAGDLWLADSVDFRLTPAATAARSLDRPHWPRSSLVAIERVADGLLLDWPKGPFHAAARLSEQPRPHDAVYALTVAENRAGLRPAADSRIVRIEFRVAASAGLFRLQESPAAGAAANPILELRWSPETANSIALVPAAGSSASATPARFRHPESPPVRPVIGTRVVFEQGAFGRRLWIEERFVAEQTGVSNRPLACEWHQVSTTASQPSPPPPVEDVRCWITLPPTVASVPVRQTDLDSLQTTGGTVGYGRITALSSEHVTWETGRTTPTSDTRSIGLARGPTAPVPIHGWIGDLRLKSGGLPWRVAVQQFTSTGVDVAHPLLGPLHVPADRVDRFTPAFRGEALLVEAGRCHLGDEFRPDFDEPTPRGLSWTATVSARQLADLRKQAQVSSGLAPRHLLFRALVRELGGPSGQRSNLVLRLNGRTIGPLSPRATSALADERVELQIPADGWRPDDNQIAVLPDPQAASPATNAPGAADDIELVNPTIEWHAPPDGS